MVDVPTNRGGNRLAPLDPSHDNIEEPQRGVDYAESYPLADTTAQYY